MSDWISQLQHPDPRQRKTAIAALAKAKDMASIGELEQVSRHDPDEHIREYAAQAIPYIQKQTTNNGKTLTEPAFLQNVTFQALPASQPLQTASRSRDRNWWVSDLTFHTTVNVLGCLLFVLLILPNSASALLHLRSNVDSYDYRYYPELRLAQTILNAQLNELVVAGVLVGIFSVFSAFLVFRLMHQVATRLFNGANTFPGMLHEALLPYTIMSAVLYVLFYLASLVNPLFFVSTGDTPLAFLVTLVVTAIFGAAYVALGYFIGKAYEFGTQKGCLTVVIAFTLCVVGGFLMGTLFSSH